MHNHPPSGPERAAGARSCLTARRSSLTEALDGLCAMAGELDRAAEAMVACLRAGGRVLVAGNGGSAAEAQHFATELVGRFLRERAPYAVIALTADTAILTSVANDYGYDEVFARQIGAYGRPGDLFVGFSTSGGSPNVVNAARTARELGVGVVAVTGERQSALSDLADIAIRVPATATPLVQELHTIVLHVLCELVEGALAAPARDQLVAVQ